MIAFFAPLDESIRLGFRLRMRARQHATERSAEAYERANGWRHLLPIAVPASWQPRYDVPRTRAECPPDTVPCPHLACRDHLWVFTGEDRAGRPHDGERPPPLFAPVTAETCARRVVARHPDGLGHVSIGKLFGITGERVRQIRRRATAKLAARRSDDE